MKTARLIINKENKVIGTIAGEGDKPVALRYEANERPTPCGIDEVVSINPDFEKFEIYRQ